MDGERDGGRREGGVKGGRERGRKRGREGSTNLVVVFGVWSLVEGGREGGREGSQGTYIIVRVIYTPENVVVDFLRRAAESSIHILTSPSARFQEKQPVLFGKGLPLCGGNGAAGL